MNHRFCSRLTALALTLALTSSGELLAAGARVRLFALVVANNQSVDTSVPSLRYADDDAARMTELLDAVASRVELLTVMDDETQKTFAAQVERARQPTRAELRAAMARLRGAMLAARRAGERTSFLFYFAGHGHVGHDREGYVSLVDGRFSRSDLFREVIARSPADVNHVIVDACNAYFLVNRRGGPRRGASQRAIRAFLARESLRRYPNTGVILSTATAAESHEWARYRSGIFSHQLLSALLGGPDVDGDRRVDYRELNAYVAAANLRVTNPRARIEIYARPPASHRRAALLDLRWLRPVTAADRRRPAAARVGGYLEVPRGMRGHYYLEDDRGVRYLDFNKSDEQPLRLALLDRPHYYLRSADKEALIKLGAEPLTRRSAASLAFAPTPTRSRGSVEESFRRHLYGFPFGRSFVAGFDAARSRPPGASLLPPPAVSPGADRPWYGRAGTWKWITLGAGLAGLGAGVTLQLLARDADDELDRGRGQISMTDAVALQRTARDRQTAAAIAFGVGGSAAIASLVLFVVDRVAGDRGDPDPPRSTDLGATDDHDNLAGLDRPERLGAQAARWVLPQLHPGGASIAVGATF